MTKKTTTKKQFEEFKKEFTHWQNHFGLFGWHVYFYHVDMGKDSYADIRLAVESRVAIVRFNLKLDSVSYEQHNIARSAKHEAIHLLLAPLADLNSEPFVTERQCIEAEENLVRVLEKVINDTRE